MIVYCILLGIEDVKETGIWESQDDNPCIWCNGVNDLHIEFRFCCCFNHDITIRVIGWDLPHRSVYLNGDRWYAKLLIKDIHIFLHSGTAKWDDINHRLSLACEALFY